MTEIDEAKLRETFRLNNGYLERIDNRFNSPVWKVVENKANNGDGYCRVRFKGRMIRYHNIVWILTYGLDSLEGKEIDHIDGNGINNSIENLRAVTNRENNQNRKVHREGQLFGTCFHKRVRKYRSQIRINNKQIHLGYFDTEKEGHEVYVLACQLIEEYVDNESFRELLKHKVSAPFGRKV